MGFCRTNLFKRLESCGQSFLLSLERHILRNYVFLYAIENGKEIPIGAQGAEMLDARLSDADSDAVDSLPFIEDQDEDEANPQPLDGHGLRTEQEFRRRAAEIYALYERDYQRRFKWLRPALFDGALAKDLLKDATDLFTILGTCGQWEPVNDLKLNALYKLLAVNHPNDKIIVFTQFADTVDYLTAQLKGRGLSKIEGVTGQSADPTQLAWRFSPQSNDKRSQITPADELRVLIATDVLSEGQNLQDCAVVVNFDLPWAIIRLVQRAGRVDRIGQCADRILCYSFLPADGVERIIHLRSAVRQRLRENAEVVGTDENFFEDDRNDQIVLDLYNEKAGILDGDDSSEVDLASVCLSNLENDAITRNQSLEKNHPRTAGRDLLNTGAPAQTR
jgi:hypothetical protein